MLFVIDANNLAGQLGLLECADFDLMLVAQVKDYFCDKNEIILVFDPRDSLGDRYRDGNLEIVYAPHDDYYRNADDKILEIIKNHLSNESFKKEIRVVTNDIELKNKIKDAMGESPIGWRVKLIRANDFASEMRRMLSGVEGADEKNIEDPDFDKELLEAWLKK